MFYRHHIFSLIPHIQTSVLPFSTLALTNQQMLNSISSIIEPTTYAHASLHVIGWQQVMFTDFEVLMSNRTWEALELPKGHKAISYKRVYKVKYKSDESIK